MNAETLAEWFRRQGHTVVRTRSSFWYDAGARVLQAFPYHWLIEPSEQELRGLLVRNNAVALRYSTPLEAARGKVSYHVVCRDPAYDLGCLNRQARQNVRRGLEYAHIEQIPIGRLAGEGWPLRQDSLRRQGRLGTETEAEWRRLCASAEGLPGFEAWAAVHDGEMVASFLAFVCDDTLMLPYEQSASAHLEHRINNALFYAMIRGAMARPHVSAVFFCLQSLDAPESVDEFKFRMGCAARAVRQRVVFHPLLAPMFNRASHAAMRWAMSHSSSHPALAKSEGVVRFYLEGRRPAGEQDWPACLAGRRDEWPAATHKEASSAQPRP